jgi:exopolyphosphatase/guanosine-5'-triphosphate,3'-diphosphate pyrophosphatase
MPDDSGAPRRRADRSSYGREAPLYAALDLGTNNCRLLIARPTREGFRVVDSFSRIVRLGEGLSHTGRLDDDAMDRAHEALRICADRIARQGLPASRVSAVATQACRAAANGADFIQRIALDTGLTMRIIDPVEEARLSVQGCANLFDPVAEAVLVVDVGGGSTELSWLKKTPQGFETVTWMSASIGVVTLAERHPEPSPSTEAWFEAMVADVRALIDAHDGAAELRDLFIEGRAQMVGTSGAITSLAGIHLGLARYDRNRVDGLWMTRTECDDAATKLKALGPQGRAAEACIGADRADLVLAGAAILEAIQRSWPCPRVRVADRGLREGLLLTAMARGRRRSRRNRR